MCCVRKVSSIPLHLHSLSLINPLAEQIQPQSEQRKAFVVVQAVNYSRIVSAPVWISALYTTVIPGSTECQSEAWKHTAFLHRELCKRLGVLKRVWLWDDTDNNVVKLFRPGRENPLDEQAQLELKLMTLAEEVGIAEAGIRDLTRMAALQRLGEEALGSEASRPCLSREENEAPARFQMSCHHRNRTGDGARGDKGDVWVRKMRFWTRLVLPGPNDLTTCGGQEAP